jgi:parallel beta-helix repeat protein
VDAASPGDVIRIEPGIYKEAVTVSKANIKMVGITSAAGEEVIIKNPGNEDNGIRVTDEGDGFVLVNVTVKGFKENGVILIRVDNFKLNKVKTINNGEYGIFPVLCNNGVVEYCSATGHSDTGIYIGQSSNVILRFNVASANVIGLEVENASNITVTKNYTHNNVTGILVDLLPGKQLKANSDIVIKDNLILNNNHENFGEEGSLESVIPSGIGILILGSDNVLVKQNSIKGNNFFGVGVFSSKVLGVLANVPDEAFADIEPNPDGVKVVENILVKNGSAPPQIAIPLPGVDLLWDGTGTNNCWARNLFTTSYPSPLPSCNQIR